MRVQINFDSKLSEREKIGSLNVIAYSVDGWIKQYENAPLWEKYKWEQGIERGGTMLTRVNIITKCKGTVLSIKIKPMQRRKL
jgi:hypothetical protein